MEQSSIYLNNTSCKILILGKGAREMVIKETLMKTTSNIEVFVMNIPEKEKYFLIVEFCKKKNISMVIPSTEVYLCNGIYDILKSEISDIRVFGPDMKQAKIEGSKHYSKLLMKKLEIPTANFTFYDNKYFCLNEIIHSNERSNTSSPYSTSSMEDEISQDIFKHDTTKENFYNEIVIKFSGLAAGKGVYIPENKQETEQIITHLFNNGLKEILIEEKLVGTEVSVLAFCNGKECSIMPQAQDYKRIYDGDNGPNTGGMGAIAPVNVLTPEELATVKSHINKVVTNLNYKGILYAGLMKTDEGVYFLEFNSRFGDPEAQVILNLLDDDLYKIMNDCIDGNELNISWKNKKATTVVLSHIDYPYSKSKRKLEITMNESIDNNINIYESNVNIEKYGINKGKRYTTGGRVMSMVCVAETFNEALNGVYKNIDKISYEGAYYRRDIGSNYLNYNKQDKEKSKIIEKENKVNYDVNIEEGNLLVDELKKSNPFIGGFCAEYLHKGINLVASADGVGTKIDLSQKYNKLNTIGIDLVAMNVNDIMVGGAKPLFFMDYISLGNMNKNTCMEIIKGINEGCKQANCKLIGGETAEMKGIYLKDKLDIAGFCVGEKIYNVSNKKEMREGSILYGIKSTGIHSNGYTLVRKLLENMEENNETISTELINEIMAPTKIYYELLDIYKNYSKSILGVAHITGGGYKDNIKRIIPESLTFKLENWEIPNVFQWIQNKSNLNRKEMLDIFNCGYGVVIISNSVLPFDIIGNLVNI